MSDTTLVLVRPDGTYEDVPNTFDGIKDALEDRPFDFIYAGPQLGCYVDDEGLLIGLPLNVPVSILTHRSVYGPAVCTKGDTDDEGDTLPMHNRVREILHGTADAWRSVVANAEATGQNPYAYANEATIPPAEIVSFGSHEEFMAYLEGEQR